MGPALVPKYVTHHHHLLWELWSTGRFGGVRHPWAPLGSTALAVWGPLPFPRCCRHRAPQHCCPSGRAFVRSPLLPSPFTTLSSWLSSAPTSFFPWGFSSPGPHFSCPPGGARLPSPLCYQGFGLLLAPLPCLWVELGSPLPTPGLIPLAPLPAPGLIPLAPLPAPGPPPAPGLVPSAPLPACLLPHCCGFFPHRPLASFLWPHLLPLALSLWPHHLPWASFLRPH